MALRSFFPSVNCIKLLLFLWCFNVHNVACAQAEDVNPLANQEIYKRGFLYSLTIPKVIPLHYQQINCHLWVDKSIDVATSSDQKVTIFGLAVDIRTAETALCSIAHNLAQALCISEKRFHEECDFICGRYAVIYNPQKDITRIVTDATSMRAIYYSQDGTLITGHAKLLADNLAGKFVAPIVSAALMDGYPGRMTPYAGVFTLLPNTALTIGTGSLSRFYPRGPLQRLSPDRVVAMVVPWLANALIGARKHKPFVVSLTAGIDTRTTMAIEHVINREKPSLYFTYSTNKRLSECGDYRNSRIIIDAKVAEHIARCLKLSHKVINIDVRETRKNFSAMEILTFQANAFHKHFPAMTKTLKNEFNDQFIHIRSQICEIMRAYYTWAKVTSDTSDWFFQITHKKFCNYFDSETLQALANDYLKTTQLDRKALFNYDCRDIYCWEQGTATWAPEVFIETDLAYETFIPWNARAIITALLQVPFEDRWKATIFKKIIARFCPEIKDLAINPRTWPPLAS
jgi:hypothetical protein